MWRPGIPDACRRRSACRTSVVLPDWRGPVTADDPRRQLVGQETNELVDEGALEGFHERNDNLPNSFAQELICF